MSPVEQFIARMNAITLERYAWLSGASEQVRRWRAEDEANGIIWQSQGTGAATGSPGNPLPSDQ